MDRARTALLALALTGALVACADDAADPTAVAQSGRSAPDPTPQADRTPPPDDDAPAEEPSEGAAAPFAADASADEQAPSGGPLTVTEVRVAPQDGYDRVVFELAGKEPGSPGWTVRYDDDPRAQGSGDPVDVDGEHTLAVLITGAGYPFDTGVEEVSGDPGLPSGLRVVEDVELGAVFEGQYEAFIGTSSRAPFRVFRLEDPARVVIDVATG